MREKPPRFAGGFTAEAVTLNEKQNVAKLMLTCLVNLKAVCNLKFHGEKCQIGTRIYAAFICVPFLFNFSNP